MIQLKGKLLVFDAETTSNIAHETRIVQLHMMKISPKGEREDMTWLINPEQPITKGAFEAHGISDEDVKTCPTFKQVAVQIYNFCSDASHILTYKGNSFDIPILLRQFEEVGVIWDISGIDLIDVYKLVLMMNPRTLGAMYAQYTGETLEGAHDASADVFATAKLLHYMMLAHPEIPQDPKQIELFQNDGRHRLDVGGTFAYNDEGKIIFQRGKHAGEVVDLQKHKGYMEWMKKVEKPPFPKDTVDIVNKFLNNQISN